VRRCVYPFTRALVGRDAVVPDQRSDQRGYAGTATTRSQSVAGTKALKTKKPAAGGGAAGFSKRTEQRLGGGVSPFLQTPLGGGVGRLKLEGLREEVHHFDKSDHTPTTNRSNALCCTAAMQKIQVGKAYEQSKDPTDLRRGDRRKNARVISGRRSSLKDQMLWG